MKDYIEIPIEQLEKTETPGVMRVKPTESFLKWVAHQRLILIVPPTKEQYNEWKRLAAERPDSWHAKVLALPENQDLFSEFK